MKKVITTIISIFYVSAFLFSQVGELDPSFADNGIFTLNHGGHEVPKAMDVQADGKLIFVLSYDAPGVSFGFDIAIIRLNQDGSLDSTFAVNGLYHYSNPISSDLAFDIKALDDGTILASGSHGTSAANPDMLLIKLNADGTPDMTFGTNGATILPIGSSEDYAQCFAINEEGKIIVGGKTYVPGSNYYRNVVCRFNANGVLDSTFADNGIFIWAPEDSRHEILDIAIANDGHIFASGKVAPAGTDRLSLYKIKEDGSSLDSTFAVNGELLAPFQGRADGLIIHSNENVLITGGNFNVNGFDLVVLAYHQDGTPNTDFGQDGVFLLDADVTDYGTALIEQPDGKIIAVGHSGGEFLTPPPGSFLSVRMDAMGILDTSWGGDGYVVTNISSEGNGAIAHTVAIQPDGKVVLAGQWALQNNDMLVMRYGNFIDADMDTYGLDVDCNDFEAAINPGEDETPYNGIDDDCNPLTLDDDLDQDGFNLADDCDDTNENVNTQAEEVPYNGLDDDCNPLTLDDDLDQDGFDFADDCDDTNENINDDAIEIPNNGIDEDCDGEDLIVGIRETTLAQRFNLYPNPTNGEVNITYNTEELDINFIEISDYTGKKIRRINTANSLDRITVSMDDLPQGLWMLIIHTTDGVAVKRVLKN